MISLRPKAFVPWVEGYGDAAGTFTLTLTTIPEVGEGQSCDPEGLDNICAEGLDCFGETPVCTVTNPPVLADASVLMFDNSQDTVMDSFKIVCERQ